MYKRQGISDTRFALDNAAALAAQVEALADKPEGFAVLDLSLIHIFFAPLRCFCICSAT